jgi:hypothetical protein
MKTIKLLTALAILFSVLNCSKITDKFGEKVEKEVNEKVDKEIKKNTEEIDKQMKQADSLLKAADEELNKEKKLTEALDEEKILKDPSGQWAINAEASSSYGSASGKSQSWSPEQMIGEPNVEKYGDNANGWAPKDPDKGIEWVKLTFPKAVYAHGLRVRQNYNPGSIVKVELFDENGKAYVIWSGTDKTKYKENTIQYFVAEFEKTKYKTKSVKITLATNVVNGWDEIDAVQLLGE